MDRIILVTSTVFLSPSTFPDKFELQIIRNNQFCEGAQPIFQGVEVVATVENAAKQDVIFCEDEAQRRR